MTSGARVQQVLPARWLDRINPPEDLPGDFDEQLKAMGYSQ